MFLLILILYKYRSDDHSIVLYRSDLSIRSPHVRMCVQHGTHQGRTRTRYAADEDERHEAVVRVRLAIERPNHVFLFGKLAYYTHINAYTYVRI